MKKNKNKGVSLLYVLIILSIITIFSVNFIYFVKERNDIMNIRGKNGG